MLEMRPKHVKAGRVTFDFCNFQSYLISAISFSSNPYTLKLTTHNINVAYCMGLIFSVFRIMHDGLFDI